ncbi:MAG: DEAD/DEAH box helicase family protein, partial [Limnohabitans sp.]
MSLFTLESLPYQTHAVEAVVRVFEGTQKRSADEVGNRCGLTWEDLKDNIERMATANGILDDRVHLTAPDQGQALDVCVEMETGTGKTLVYLSTLYALHQRYGWSKFIIVVPSLAIRAGVMNTLSDFGLQLAQLHGLNHAIPCFEYDSSKLHQLKSFIDSPTAAIMVMNSQAFVGKGKVISNDQNEAPLDGMTWLQALARCRPVVVMDEPQNGMDTDAALEAFGEMKPLAKLRYSATHQKDAMRNCVYRLTPAQAYAQGLVKKLEVMTVDEQHAEGTVQISLSDTQVGKGQLPKCKLKLWHQSASGEQTYKVSKWLGVGDDLAEETQNRSYVGWRIEHIHKSLETNKWEVQFDNGQTLLEDQDMGHDQEGIFRLQLRWLIHRHFEKKAILAKHGIKCLSLIFIDRVANYLAMTPTETPLIKRLFDEEYAIKVKDLLGTPPTSEHIRQVQTSYFARTGKGEYTDNENSMAKNQAIFKDIVNDKAALIQLNNPVEFIFSHSALGVGWDNPNVFNIATLRHSRKEEKKRQELGRGLRICINQQGQRVYEQPDTPLGQEINLLTVVPNQSYQTYAQSYQQEIEEAYGNDGNPTPLPRHTRAGVLQKTTLKLRDEMVHSEAFQ